MTLNTYLMILKHLPRIELQRRNEFLQIFPTTFKQICLTKESYFSKTFNFALKEDNFASDYLPEPPTPINSA